MDVESVDPVAALDFEQAFAMLQTLVDFDEVEQLHPSGANAVYTTKCFLTQTKVVWSERLAESYDRV